MGVQGLWQILEPTATPVALESLEGKRIAVDISLWLHQALQGFNAHGTDSRAPHLVLLINRIAKLLFYKIRPVFVFDGDQIPIFKRHLLRDRELRRFTDQLIVNKQQKRALLEAATGSQAPGEPLKKKARAEDNDLFALPEDLPALPETSTTANSNNFADDKFLSNYHNLISRDEKIAFLAEAKQRVKKTRLNDKDIPTDAVNFFHFQKERILRRNQIDNEIDSLRSEKAHQSAQLKNDKIKMVIVDAHARSHLLTKDHDSDIEIISPEKKKAEKVPWTEFVKQVRQSYYKKGDEPSTSRKAASTSPAKIQQLNASSNQPINEEDDYEVEEDSDDDVAETFRVVEAEDSRRRNKNEENPTIQVGHIPSKTSAIDNFIGRMNALKKRGENFSTQHNDNASDSDSDFEEVPLSGPKIASARNLTLNQMTKAKPVEVESPEIVLDSDDEDDVGFSGRKVADGSLYDREDEKGVYSECQQLLTFLGLPYIVAPGEAEAQCSELERLGLVEGIVTDDSDIWLFNGKKVYKNMFSKKRNVHFFQQDTIEKELGLNHLHCIQLTMLAGGDYTRGFDGVGMVTALEILAEFRPKDKKVVEEKDAFEVLELIRKWLDKKREYEAKPISSRPKDFIESATRIRLRKTIEKENDEEKIEAFPNKDVYEAYCHPVVDSNNTSFKWKPINFEGLEEFLWSSIGWSMEELHRKTHKAYNIWDEFIKRTSQSYQTRITGFAQKMQKSPDDQLLAPTKRVQTALNKLFKVKGINPDDAAPITKKKNPTCLRPPLPKPQPDDFYDESLDEEVFRLLEEKKKNDADQQQASSSSAPQKRATRSRHTVSKISKPISKPKILPATLQPSELNLSEDEGSSDD